MAYKVVVTIDAESDLDSYIQYLLFNKHNEQAALSVLTDFEETKEKLSIVAGSLKICENPKLKKFEYRRINFLHHNYFMLYRIEGEIAIIDNIFHELQDYEHKMI